MSFPPAVYLQIMSYSLSDSTSKVIRDILVLNRYSVRSGPHFSSNISE